MKKKHILAVGLGAIGLAAAAPVRASTAYDLGPTNTNSNWDSDIWSPTSGGPIVAGFRPGSTDTAYTTGSAGRSLTLNSDAGTINGYLSRSNGAVWTIQNGAILTWTGITTIAESVGAGALSSSANMTGGTLTGNIFKIGRATSSGNASGTFTQSAGNITTSTLLLTEATSSGSSTGTYNLQGTGALNITGELDPGTESANFNFTGGTLQYRGTQMSILNAGGTLKVAGAGGTNPTLLRGVSDTIGFDYTQTSGTISFDINSLSDFSNIGTHSSPVIISGSNNVTLNGTMLINVLPGLTLTDGDSFDLITTADIAESSIVDTTTLQTLGLDSGFFTKSVVAGSGNSDILRLTYSSVPEPGSLSLLAAGGILALRRRRRQA
jgi:hypothetical protein